MSDTDDGMEQHRRSASAAFAAPTGEASVMTIQVLGPIVPRAGVGRDIADLMRIELARHAERPDPPGQRKAWAEEYEAEMREARDARARRIRSEVLSFGVLLAIVLALLALIFLTGCGGGWASQARTSIEVAAVATDVGDGLVAHAVHDDCGPRVEHLDPGSEERITAADDCLHEHRFDAAAHAIAAIDHALRAAQAAVDAAEHAGRSAIWDAIAPQLTRAWCDLDVALADAGIRMPDAVTLPLMALQAVAGTCRPPVTDAAGRPL